MPAGYPSSTSCIVLLLLYYSQMYLYFVLVDLRWPAKVSSDLSCFSDLTKLINPCLAWDFVTIYSEECMVEGN